MVSDVLEIARKYMAMRQFDRAVKLLEGRSEIYEQNFDYYLLLAISYLYAGDFGTASTYFQRARNIKLTDTNLLLGQAILFLRRGDTGRALTYYLEIIDNEPENKIALKAMEFIRTKGDYSTICRWIDTGMIEQFYPPLGVNPYKVIGIGIPAAACILGILLAFVFMPYRRPSEGKRADLSSLVLTVSEKRDLREKDLSSGAFSYILSSSQIYESYEKALSYFQSYRDNLAQIEVNRILNSNASVFVKRNMNELMGYFVSPGFDSIKDSPDYSHVLKEPKLYLDCWVVWSGRVSNVIQTENSYLCDFLVGYDSMERVDGVVPLHFSVPPVIEVEKPVKVLARITTRDDKLSLEGKAVYQSVK